MSAYADDEPGMVVDESSQLLYAFDELGGVARPSVDTI